MTVRHAGGQRRPDRRQLESRLRTLADTKEKQNVERTFTSAWGWTRPGHFPFFRRGMDHAGLLPSPCQIRFHGIKPQAGPVALRANASLIPACYLFHD